MKNYVSLLTLICLLLCVFAFDLQGAWATKPNVLGRERELSLASVAAQQNSSLRRITVRRARFQGCDLTHQEVKDLSGEYKGQLFAEQQTFKDAILTIDKERFSLKTNSGTFSGILSAVKTCAYTAVALKIEDADVMGMAWQEMEGHSMSLKATKNSGTFTLESTDLNVPFKFQCDCTKCKHECDCCPGLRLLP